LSFVRRNADTGEEEHPYGNAPVGYLSLGRDGRVLALIVRENRPKPADLTRLTTQEQLELFNSMVAYGGSFRLEDNRFITDVDISWNENWTGTRQPRNFTIEGDQLIISVDPQIGPNGKRVTALATWQRVT
jgi:hypothetical protein